MRQTNNNKTESKSFNAKGRSMASCHRGTCASMHIAQRRKGRKKNSLLLMGDGLALRYATQNVEGCIPKQNEGTMYKSIRREDSALQ